MRPNEALFRKAYERLSKQGRCDEPGGSEYERVFSEWVADGCTPEVELFIGVYANSPPPIDMRRKNEN